MKGEDQKTILLVDDEAIIAMSEKMTLERFGYKVITANTGEEAVALVEKTPAIDLILMDINLGAGMDGTEAAAIILKNHDLPVVFLSSHTEPEVVAKTEKITSYGYVVKNSSSTVLDASIKMAFKLFAAKIKEQEKEKALRESEASYRVLFSGASDGILLADAQTRQFRYANPAICRMLGYTEKEFLRLSVADIHPKESLDHVLAEFAALARGEIRSSPDLPCLRKDGTIFYADISHSAVILEGREYLAGFFHDITERKLVSDTVKESELRLKAQYQCMPIPTFTWRKKGEDFELIDFNDAAKAITHEKTSEFVGRKASDLYAGRQDILHDLQQCLIERKVIKKETQSEHFIPGKHIILTIVPIPADLVMVHMEDISERKRAEVMLRESEERLRDFIFSMADWVWEVDEKGVYIYSSVKGKEFLGASRGDIIGKTPFDFMPAAEAKRVGAIFSEIAAKKLPIRDLENWNISRNGESICLLTNAVPILDEKGNLKGYRGVDKDITERKRAEEALRKSEEHFRTFYEDSPLGLYRTTPDGRIHLANPALIRMLGYSSYADLVDRDLEKAGFEPSYPRAQFVEKIEKHGEVKGIESVWKRNDGTTIIVRESARAIRDARGKTLYYDGIVEDITERKRVEKLPETLYKISQAMLMSSDLAELYPRIHDLIAGIVPAGNFFIALLADDGKTLGFPYYRDEKDNSENELIQADDPQSLTVEVLRTNKTLLLNETQLQERYATGRNRVWGTAPRCWLGVPLLVREKVIGVMAIQDYRDGNAYGPRDILLLESTAGQIAMAIDRKRAEKALRESEEQFHSLFDNMNEGVALHELVFENGNPANYRIINVNDRFLKILGLSGQQMIGKLASEAYGTATAPYLEEYAGVAGSKKAVSFETYFAPLDKHFAISAVPWREGGFATIFTDISERKRAGLLEQAVYEIARAADKAASLDDLYRSVHRIIQTLMPATNILIARYDEKEDQVSFPYFVDEKDPMPKPRKSGRGLTDYVLRTGRTLLSDAALEKGLERSGEAKRRGSPSACWLGVPLKFGDKAIGVIALDNYSDPKAYGEREQKILEYVSSQIANAIERKQAEAEIKRQLAEKEVLLKEVHHRIKNNIASIAGLISLRLQSISNPEAAAVLKETVGRVDSMRLLYDKLLLSEGYQNISVKGYVESLAAAVVSLFPDQARIKLEMHIADFQLHSKQLFPLGIIINELLTNKMKYAFSGRKNGSIRIDLVREGNHVTLAIEDDGNVLPAGFDLNETEGFGLMLVKMLSQQLSGIFSIAADKGTRCTVGFDI